MLCSIETVPLPTGRTVPGAKLSVDRSHAWRVSFDRRSTGWATAEAARGKIRSNHEHGCDQLRNESFNGWENGEPDAHPLRDGCLKKSDWRSWDPAGQL